jgi:hypothetical protein
MLHVAAPEENQAGFQLLFLGNKRHVASCCLFRSVLSEGVSRTLRTPQSKSLS